MDKNQISSGVSYMESIGNWFPGIKHIKTENYHQISPLLQHEWIDVEKAVQKMDQK